MKIGSAVIRTSQPVTPTPVSRKFSIQKKAERFGGVIPGLENPVRPALTGL